MSAGLKDTFAFLVKTDNEAAVDVLIAAMDCPQRAVRDRALRSLLARRSPRAHVEVFRRLSSLDRRCRSIISERPDRLARAARDVLHNVDEANSAAIFRAVLSFRLYDTMPALVGILKEKNHPNARLAAETIPKLTASFYQELCKVQSERKDLENLRRRVTFALEEAVRRFDHHERTEVVEAFLLVAKPQNVTLRRLLQQPRDKVRQALVDVMSDSPRGGVIRLLLGFLEDRAMPQAVKKVISGRSDLKFVGNLLQKTGPRPSRAVATTLAGFDHFAWAKPRHRLFQQLSGTAQHNAVQLLMATSINREELFEVVRFVLAEGKPGGRRAAAERLAEFEGPQADALVAEALEDEDPGVRAHLIGQVRSRQIPGWLSLLFGMVDSPHAEVRDALRDALPEFTVRQFLGNLSSIPEALLPTAGHLVRKIDLNAEADLTEQMGGLSPVRRRRAVVAASAMGLVQDLEESVIRLLSDEDHMVRVAAAEALAECETVPSWGALRDALFDRSVTVKEAAERSLSQISQSLVHEVEEVEEAIS